MRWRDDDKECHLTNNTTACPKLSALPLLWFCGPKKSQSKDADNKSEQIIPGQGGGSEWIEVTERARLFPGWGWNALAFIKAEKWALIHPQRGWENAVKWVGLWEESWTSRTETERDSRFMGLSSHSKAAQLNNFSWTEKAGLDIKGQCFRTLRDGSSEEQERICSDRTVLFFFLDDLPWLKSWRWVSVPSWISYIKLELNITLFTPKML